MAAGEETNATTGEANATTGCCPPGSLPYLSSDYLPRGSTTETNGVELYVTGDQQAEKALLLCPDVWGWAGGRVRAVADGFADRGYFVAVAKLLAPGLDGGTEGDALPPDGAFSMDWIKGFPWTKQKPKVDAALSFLRANGATRIGVLGFCYGGHPCCWASAENPDVLAAVVFHPSIQLESFAFEGDCEALLKRVQCPVMLQPAGNDLPMWAEDSDYGKALRGSAKGSECEWRPFAEMTHGWTCRGDLSEPAVARDVAGAMEEANAFLEKHMNGEQQAAL